MPIRIPNDLPAAPILRQEGLVVMREEEAARQDIRPLEIAILNLMPEKVKTETQIARQLGRTALQVNISLVTTSSYRPRNAPEGHMAAFYKPWTEIARNKYDGLIITGAPIERLPFEDVAYWPELVDIFNWAAGNVTSMLALCWGAQALLYHLYGLPKVEYPGKLSGVYEHRRVAERYPIISGFDDCFRVPVSRWTEVPRAAIAGEADLVILADSDIAGVCLAQDRAGRNIYMFNHFEYDADTLAWEYARDQEAGGAPKVPANYFPGDDPTRTPRNTWRSHAQLLYGNWINAVYQMTPFDRQAIAGGG